MQLRYVPLTARSGTAGLILASSVLVTCSGPLDFFPCNPYYRDRVLRQRRRIFNILCPFILRLTCWIPPEDRDTDWLLGPAPCLLSHSTDGGTSSAFALDPFQSMICALFFLVSDYLSYVYVFDPSHRTISHRAHKPIRRAEAKEGRVYSARRLSATM
jgi:hypothetical protein